MKKFGEKRFSYRFFFRVMLETSINKKLKTQWAEFLNEKMDLLQKEEGIRSNLIESLNLVKEPHIEAFNLLLSTLDRLKLKNNDIRRLMNGLKENKGFFQMIEKNDYLVQKIAKIIQKNFAEDKNLRLLSIFVFVMKLNNFKPRNHSFLPVIEKFLLSDSTLELSIQMQAATFLLNKKALSAKAAETLLKKLTQQKSGIPENILRIRLLNQSVVGTNIPEDKLVLLTKNYNQIKENLNNPSTRQVLSNLALILSFPPEIIKEDVEFLKKTLEDFILQGNSNSYMNLLKGLNDHNVRKNREIYGNFLKVFTSSFNSFTSKMPYMDILDSLNIRRASPPGQVRKFKTDGSNLPWVVEDLKKRDMDAYRN